MLNKRLSGYVNYFESLAKQPSNRWDGFYITPHEEKHFALRYQIAFSCFALGALCLHPKADEFDQTRCRDAMTALIERMLQRRVWAYWALEAERHGLSPDPIKKGNIQYSGLLAMMIGIFEAAGGDARYDEPFTLLWTSNERFVYTHHTLIETIWQQMEDNHHHGIDSEPGRTYTAHMNLALWANVLHDGLHGSKYADINVQWMDFLQRRMILFGPRMVGRGVFGSFYMSSSRLPVTVGMNFVDAWTLAFLALLEPDFTHKLSARFFRGVRYLANTAPPRRQAEADKSQEHDEPPAPSQQAYIPSATMWRSKEMADQYVTTGFGYLLAVHLGDTALASSFLSYADQAIQPVEQESKRWYAGGLAAPFTTALFALGEAGGFTFIYEAAFSQRVPRAPAEAQTTEQPVSVPPEQKKPAPVQPEQAKPERDIVPAEKEQEKEKQ